MVTMADDAQRQHLHLRLRLHRRFPAGGPAPNTAEYPGWVMAEGMLAANAPAPTIAVDEDDELYLTLTNVGMAMRPDLFDPHTVHWHGFPKAAPIFDGVPDSSISINMGGQPDLLLQRQGPGHLHVPLPRGGHRAHADGHARQPVRAAAAEPG